MNKKLTVMTSCLLLISSIVLGQDSAWDMGIEKRVSDLENRVNSLEKIAEEWNQGAKKSTTPGHEIQRGTEVCPCPEGGKCVCPPDNCPCELCLKHLTNEKVVSIYIKNEKEIAKIWEELGDKEDSTMRKAVETWITRKKYKGTETPAIADSSTVTINDKEWKGTKPTNKGREVLLFTSTTCPPCPAAIERIGELSKDVIYIDCTEEGGPGHTLAGMHRVDSYPTMIAIDDGIKVNGLHTEGSSVGSFLAAKWLKKESAQSQYSSSKPAQSQFTQSEVSLRRHLVQEHNYLQSVVNKMTDEEVRAAHTRAHDSPVSSSTTTSRSMSAYSQSYSPARSSPQRMVTSAPTYRNSVASYGGSTWTWPGDLRSHLMSAHGIPASQLAGLSHGQMVTIHNNLHNTGRSGISSAGMSTPRSSYRPLTYLNSYPSYYYSSGSSCPTCPR